jgi:hypothetical protein
MAERGALLAPFMSLSADALPARPGLQDGGIMHFKIKKLTKLKRFMEMFCVRHSLQMDQICLLFYGKLLRDSQSPTS